MPDPDIYRQQIAKARHLGTYSKDADLERLTAVCVLLARVSEILHDVNDPIVMLWSEDSDRLVERICRMPGPIDGTVSYAKFGGRDIVFPAPRTLSSREENRRRAKTTAAPPVKAPIVIAQTALPVIIEESKPKDRRMAVAESQAKPVSAPMRAMEFWD